MTNPLLQASALPHFDLIKTEHVEPAIDQILQDNRHAIAQITALKEFSWETLARPMEELDNRLNDAWSAVSHLNAVVNDEALRDAYNNCLAKLTAYSTEVGQNKALCDAYKTLADSEAFKSLNQQSRKSIENILKAFHLSGVDLDDDKKARFSELSNRLSELTSKFSENVLDATQGWHRHITDEKELTGLPESACIVVGVMNFVADSVITTCTSNLFFSSENCIFSTKGILSLANLPIGLGTSTITPTKSLVKLSSLVLSSSREYL